MIAPIETLQPQDIEAPYRALAMQLQATLDELSPAPDTFRRDPRGDRTGAVIDAGRALLSQMKKQAGPKYALCDGRHSGPRCADPDCYLPHESRLARLRAQPARILTALREAWRLGQAYSEQAESDFASENRKADATRAKFEALLADVSALLEPDPAADTKGGA